ncbi:hypothetical protein [Flavobacterium luteum]|uniref:Uncharacterized protein n=1 Tax=Flavobacterium luteum TaxID=2026654 RepID=A0A7J5AG79_9FLAO|nr:hypothetical protein [Flavobacterium luteum]KAB1156520.1 hypothetical protein F6464_03955 [Flavobacterium luteum]
MTKSKIYKFSGVFVLLCTIGAGIWYWQLPNRHKAIIKTVFLQETGIVDNKWIIDNSHLEYKMISPTFYIDGIYKSMEGPKSSNYIKLSQDSTLLWLTGFHVKALDSKTKKQVSNDFICHTNIDFNDVKYFSNFNLNERIGIYYPRLTSLSHGLENFTFPNGYGIPMKGNDLLYITTESLNHNITNANFCIKHEVTVDYSKKNTNIKPLLSRTAFIMLPYNKSDPYKSTIDTGKDYCVPVETKNHSYDFGDGNVLSGHWIIPIGKKTYSSSIDGQLQIKDSLQLHAAAVHVHPFATALTLWDKTTKTAIFKSKMTNHTNKIGLSNINSFSSESGVWMFKNHEYELVLEVNNTTKSNQDMMASMFLFFYDAELDSIVNK